jgi:alcohol dehydrogenase class IV
MALFTFPRKIYFQRDIIDNLDEILNSEGSSNVLIISDKNIMSLHGERIIKNLKKGYKIFNDVLPEPTVDSIERAFKELGNEKFDTVIAVGGGSVMDFAKSIAIKISYPDKDLREVNPFETIRLNVKLIAIPTTSGTGSDVSFGIVLTDGERKLALGNYELVPHISILDSSLTPGKKEIIRATGIDAFVHAFEALSANTATIFTDALAEKAIDVIYRNLKGAMENDENAKDLVHLSATMAGMAFSNSGTALAHALGHSFGATFHIVHGTSVGLFLPYVIEFNSSDEMTKMKYKRVERMLQVDDLVDSIIQLYRELGQPYRVKDLGIKSDEYFSRIDELVSKSMQDSELAFNPVVVGEEDLRNIYKKAYGD